MRSQVVIAIGAFLFAFSAVADALAIGFEVDTPLDPFLGGLSKMKRHILRRVKDLGNDSTFVNSSPIDQLNMLFSQPNPITLPQFTFPTQQTINSPMPVQTIDQRKIGLNQIPAPVAQAMDNQLIAFLNQGLAKRGFSYPSVPGIRQIPGILQQVTQTVPFRSFPQCPVTQQKQNFF